MNRAIATMAVCALAIAACTESDDGATDTAASAPATESASTDPPATDPATSAAPETEATDGDVAETEPTEADAGSETAGTEAETASTEVAPSDGSVVSQFAGQEWFRGTVPDAAVPADEGAEPIVVAMINQENSPAGSFPELRAASTAAVAWINAELGGVGGRPIQLETCVTDFTVERSQECAQQAVQQGAVVVTSGIDVSANASIPVLEQNGLPLVGGIPATVTEMRSPVAAFFSGGTPGAYVAFAAHAAENGRSKMAFAYGEFESFEVPVKEYGVPVAESLGMATELIPFPIIGADLLPVLTSAVDSGADAIVVGAADTSCVPTMTILDDLGFQGQLYLTGACAAEEILAQVPDEVQARVVFNSEGPSETTTEGSLYEAVTQRYAVEPAGGAGTVTFRSMMNLWALLDELDTVDPAAVADALASSVDQPSFWGHPYTCDGNQLPGLPALCAPQQTLFTIEADGGDVVEKSDGWVDVPAVMAG